MNGVWGGLGKWLRKHAPPLSFCLAALSSSKGQFPLLGSHSALASFPPLRSLTHGPEITYVGSPSSVDRSDLWKGTWPVLFIA